MTLLRNVEGSHPSPGTLSILRDVVSRHDGACLEDPSESPPLRFPQLEVLGSGEHQHPYDHHAQMIV
jgi:hypothetical protein